MRPKTEKCAPRQKNAPKEMSKKCPRNAQEMSKSPKKGAQRQKILPKRRNFAKSGHTGSGVFLKRLTLKDPNEMKTTRNSIEFCSPLPSFFLLKGKKPGSGFDKLHNLEKFLFSRKIPFFFQMRNRMSGRGSFLGKNASTYSNIMF
jgi:hypothetical protein